METSFYTILDVPRDAIAREIETSYRKLAARDDNRFSFEQIADAYEILMNAQWRKIYDEHLSIAHSTALALVNRSRYHRAEPSGAADKVLLIASFERLRAIRELYTLSEGHVEHMDAVTKKIFNAQEKKLHAKKIVVLEESPQPKVDIVSKKPFSSIRSTIHEGVWTKLDINPGKVPQLRWQHQIAAERNRFGLQTDAVSSEWIEALLMLREEKTLGNEAIHITQHEAIDGFNKSWFHRLRGDVFLLMMQADEYFEQQCDAQQRKEFVQALKPSIAETAAECNAEMQGEMERMKINMYAERKIYRSAIEAEFDTVSSHYNEKMDAIVAAYKHPQQTDASPQGQGTARCATR